MSSDEANNIDRDVENLTSDEEWTDVVPDEPDKPETDQQDDHQEMDDLMDSYLDRMSGQSRHPGQVIRVPIISFHGDQTLVDVGEKAEGLVPTEELLGPDGNLRFKVGDTIEVVHKGEDSETGLVRLSHQEARRRAALDAIEEAMKNQSELRGHVARVVKGGVMVDVGMEAFMPAYMSASLPCTS